MTFARPGTLTGARVLTPDGLADTALSLVGGRIAPASDGPRVDLSGYLLLPGVVDIHGERVRAASRPATRAP